MQKELIHLSTETFPLGDVYDVVPKISKDKQKAHDKFSLERMLNGKKALISPSQMESQVKQLSSFFVGEDSSSGERMVFGIIPQLSQKESEMITPELLSAYTYARNISYLRAVRSARDQGLIDEFTARNIASRFTTETEQSDWLYSNDSEAIWGKMDVDSVINNLVKRREEEKQLSIGKIIIDETSDVTYQEGSRLAVSRGAVLSNEVSTESIHRESRKGKKIQKVFTASGVTVLFLSSCSPIPVLNFARNDSRYGFNTHMNTDNEYTDPSIQEFMDKYAEINLTPENFREDVDTLVKNGFREVRINVWEWQLGDDDINEFKKALRYAKDKGLFVTLVTNTPGLSENGSDIQGDINKVENYYLRLTKELGPHVDVWQIFNEADDHTYDSYSRLNYPYPDGYLNNLSTLVKEASEVIKQIDPDAKVTVNVSMWIGADPWGDAPGAEEIEFFDAVNDYIDIISLDLYPDTNVEAIENIPNVIEFFSKRYGKPVVISELGLPTGDGRFSEEDQAKYMAMVVNVIQDGKVKPKAIILYEIRDEADKGLNTGEGSFGFFDKDGNPKPGFKAILEAIRD